MSSRAHKDEILKRNVLINSERWIRQEQEKRRGELTPKEKEKIRKVMEESANRINRSGKHYEVFK